MLTVEHIGLDFDGRSVLNDVSFDIAPGQLIGVIGGNGAGKSSLANVLAGAYRAHAGHVRMRVDDRLTDITHWPPWKRQLLGINYVPADRPLFEDLSVRDNLRVVGAVSGFGRDFEREMDATLARFPLIASRLGQRSATLSGGERRLLAIARAILAMGLTGDHTGARFPLLILDEPAAGLAPNWRLVLADATQALRADGVAVVVFEPDKANLRGPVDRFYSMVGGELTPIHRVPGQLEPQS